MNELVLIFGGCSAAAPPAEAWAAWIAALRDQGITVRGAAPCTAGYMALHAPDLAAAAALVARCPVIEQGGTVKVRPSWLLGAPHSTPARALRAPRSPAAPRSA